MFAKKFIKLSQSSLLLGGATFLGMLNHCSARIGDTPIIRDLSTSTSYDGLQLCAQTQDSKDAGNDKYFYLFLADDYGFVQGSCLIHFGSSDSAACCTISGTYSSDDLAYYYLTVMDPSSPPYTDGLGGTYVHHWENCNKDVNTDCPNYDYNNNEQGFGNFFVRSDGNTLKNPDKYVNQGGKCGLGNKLGTCNDGGDNVFGHVHIGKDQCVQASITLFHQCDGHYGYMCYECAHS